MPSPLGKARRHARRAGRGMGVCASSQAVLLEKLISRAGAGSRPAPNLLLHEAPGSAQLLDLQGQVWHFR